MKKSRILVVEDEGIVAKDIEIKLKELGYEIAGIASTGEKAIEIARRENPDLILMDIMLKGDISGIDVAHELSEMNVPVIYLTAYSDKSTLQTAKITAPYGYIVKPFTTIDLKTNIEIALHKNINDKKAIQKRDITFQLISELNSKKNLFVRHRSQMLKIPMADIKYVEALQDYVIIYALDKKYVVHSTMKGMNEILPKHLFQRVHRSFIVQLSYIVEIDDNKLILDDNDKVIPISKSFKKELTDRLNILT